MSPPSSAAARREPSGANATAAHFSEAPEHPLHLPRGDVPEPHRQVVGGRGQGVAVGAEGDLAHDRRCDRQAWRADLAGRDVPEADRAVGSGRGQSSAVGTEGDRADLVGVAFERGDEATGRRVPESNVLRRAERGRGQGLAVGGERQGRDRAGVARHPFRSRPVAASQSLIVSSFSVSSLPEARIRPSGENATAHASSAWPARAIVGAGVNRQS